MCKHLTMKIIRDLINNHHISPGCIARLLNVSKPAVHHWARGARVMPIKKAKRLIELLKMFGIKLTLDDIYSDIKPE